MGNWAARVPSGQVPDERDATFTEKFNRDLTPIEPEDMKYELEADSKEEGQEEAGPEATGSFCTTAFRALRSRQYNSVLLFYLLNLFMYRSMQSWRSEELSWKDREMRDAGGQGIDVKLQLNTFTSLGASVHLLVIPMFGWLVARFGPEDVPFVVSTSLLIAWQGLRLIHSDWVLPATRLFPGHCVCVTLIVCGACPQAVEHYHTWYIGNVAPCLVWGGPPKQRGYPL